MPLTHVDVIKVFQKGDTNTQKNQSSSTCKLNPDNRANLQTHSLMLPLLVSNEVSGLSTETMVLFWIRPVSTASQSIYNSPN